MNAQMVERDYLPMLRQLEEKIKKNVPTYELRFKNESTLMKIMSKILFFNKGFMTKVKTVLGTKVYWTSREDYDRNPRETFGSLAHEFVHVMDYKRNPVKFALGYLFPQILATPALLFVLLSPILIPLIVFGVVPACVLWVLLTALFLAPIPSLGRKWAEMRGYGMNIKLMVWLYGLFPKHYREWYVRHFTGPTYYYMWPFKRSIEEEIDKWSDPFNLDCLDDTNPAYREVYDLLFQLRA